VHGQPKDQLFGGGLLEWDMWARIDRNRRALGPINTLPTDHKSGSPDSQAGLLPDINKPPMSGRNDNGYEERVALDTHFVCNWSV
jgi:hypothetical protein